MTLTVPVPLTADEQAALQAQAKAQGLTVDSLLRKVVLQAITAAPGSSQEQLSFAEWHKEFEAWLDGQPDMPTLSDNAISREGIYTREDEWRASRPEVNA
jgi:hypothetical protein